MYQEDGQKDTKKIPSDRPGFVAGEQKAFQSLLQEMYFYDGEDLQEDPEVENDDNGPFYF